MDLNTDMQKITFMIIITLTAILSLAVVGNAFAKSSGGGSGGSDGSGGSSDSSDIVVIIKST